MHILGASGNSGWKEAWRRGFASWSLFVALRLEAGSCANLPEGLKRCSKPECCVCRSKRVFGELFRLCRWNTGEEFPLSPRKGIHCGIGQHLFTELSNWYIYAQTARKLYSETGGKEKRIEWLTEKCGSEWWRWNVNDLFDKHLSSSYFVPGIVSSALQLLSHLILIILWGRWYYLHFTDEEN